MYIHKADGGKLRFLCDAHYSYFDAALYHCPICDRELAIANHPEEIVTPEEILTEGLKPRIPKLPIKQNSDGSYSVLLKRETHNGWQWWLKPYRGLIMTDLIKQHFKMRKVTETRKGVFVTFELKEQTNNAAR